MRLDLTRAFVTDGFVYDFDCDLPLQEQDVSTQSGDILSPVKVSGRLYNRAEVLHLDLKTDYTLSGECDRCCESVNIKRSAQTSLVLVRKKEDENSDELIEVREDSLDIYDIVYESIMLDLPYKLLCKESCKGLCPFCGQNLNLKNCDCRKPQSPFDILKQDFNS